MAKHDKANNEYILREEKEFYNSLSRLEKEFYDHSKEVYKEHSIAALRQMQADFRDQQILIQKERKFDELGMAALDKDARAQLSKLQSQIKGLVPKIQAAFNDYQGQILEAAKVNGVANGSALLVSTKTARYTPPEVKYDDPADGLNSTLRNEKISLGKKLKEIEKKMGDSFEGITPEYIKDALRLSFLEYQKYKNSDIDIDKILAGKAVGLNAIMESQKGLNKASTSGFDDNQKSEIEYRKAQVEFRRQEYENAWQKLKSEKMVQQANNDSLGFNLARGNFPELIDSERAAADALHLEIAKFNETIKTFAAGGSASSAPAKIFDMTPQKQVAEEQAVIEKIEDKAIASAEKIQEVKKNNLAETSAIETDSDKARQQAALKEHELNLVYKKAEINLKQENEKPGRSAQDSYDVFKGYGLIQNEIEFERQGKNEAKQAQTKEEREREAQDRELKQEEKYQQRKAESNIEYETRLARAREERRLEQLAREEKQEAKSLERKEEMNKRYLEQKADSEKRQAEKLAKLEELKQNGFKNAMFSAAGAVGGMLGVYGVSDSIERGMRTGVEFSSNLNLAQAIGGFDDNQVKNLEDNALKVAKATKAASSELPLLQIELTKLGKAPEEIIKSTGPVVKFAATFQTQLAQTAGTAAKAAKTFGIEMPQMLDIMGATFRNTTIKDLAQFEESLASGSAMANALGYTASQTISMLAVAIDKNQKADEASRGLQKLLSQAKNSDSEFAKYFGGTANNFNEVMARLKAMTAEEKEFALAKMKSGNLTEENAKNLLVILMNSANDIEALNKKLENSAGLIETAYQKSMKSLQNQWDLVTSEIEANIISSYKELEPELITLTKTAQNFFNEMADPDSTIAMMTDGIKTLTAAVATFAVVGGGIAGVTAAVKAMYAVIASNPVTALIAVTAAAGAALYSWKDNEEEKLKKESQRIEIAKAANEEFTKRHENEINQLQNTINLAKEYETLAAKETLAADESSRQQGILEELKKVYPEVVTGTNNQALALDQVKTAANNANTALERLTVTQKNIAKREVENELKKSQLAISKGSNNLLDGTGGGFKLTGKTDDEKKQENYFKSNAENIQLLVRDGKIKEAKTAIGWLNDELYKFKDLIQTGDNPTYIDADFINRMEQFADNANILSTELENLSGLQSKKAELFAGKKTEPGIIPGGKEPDDKPTAAELQQAAAAAFELKLVKLRLAAELAKFESDQDLTNFNLKKKYIEANYKYQIELARQPLVNYGEKNEAEKALMRQEFNQKSAILKAGHDSELTATGSQEEAAGTATKLLRANLGKLSEPASLLKYSTEYENAMLEQKKQQLDLMLEQKKISNEDYELQLDIAEIQAQQNILIAVRTEKTKAAQSETLKLELKKSQEDTKNLEIEAELVKSKTKAAIVALDEKDLDYQTKLSQLRIKEIDDLTKIEQLKASSINRTAVLNLQNRQSGFIKDYASDRKILDLNYNEKRSAVTNNKEMLPEEKTANLEKLDKDQAKEQRQLLADHVTYGLQIAQQTMNIIQRITDAIHQQELAALKKRYDEETKAANKTYNEKVKAAQGASRNLAKIEEDKKKADEAREKEYLARQKEINKKKQKWAVAEVIMNIGIAIAKAFAENTLLGWINAAGITAVGAIQIAQINAQQFNKGRVNLNLPDNQNDRILAWIGDDEAIINPESSRANAPLLNSINEAKGLYSPNLHKNEITSGMISEIRALRNDLNTGLKSNTKIITGTIASKNQEVHIHEERNGYRPEDVARIARDGNNKTAKLTVYGAN